MQLRTIAHGRAGDKGRRVNVSVIAFDAADYPRIAAAVGLTKTVSARERTTEPGGAPRGLRT